MSLQLCLNAPYIPKDEGGPVFSEPWEARAFALVVKLHDAGQFTWQEWVDTFSAEIATAESGDHAKAGHTDDYYECWVNAMEKLLTRQGLVSEASLADARIQTLATWPHPDHVAQREPIATDPARG